MANQRVMIVGGGLAGLGGKNTRRGKQVVDGVAIASDGPVYSVFLAHRGPLHEIKTIALDPASRTSCHLLKCLLAEYHDLRPDYVTTAEADARLLIGNQAIQFRQKNGSEFSYLDLGEEWMRCTGLPFAATRIGSVC